jgi:hypothetical protein
MSAVEGEITQGFSTMNCKQDLYERQISADLEILSWYRSLVDRLNVAEALAEPPAAIAAALFAGMRGAVAADSVAIVPCSSTDECFDRSSLPLNAKLDIDGERLFADAAYLDLVEAFQHDVIKSDVAAGPHGNQFANVRNVVVVQINKYGYSLGYLLAVNSRNGDGFSAGCQGSSHPRSQ